MPRISTLGLYGAPVMRAPGDFADKRHFATVGSGIREYQADFATGNVQDASFMARPDAIVGRIAFAPGPRALQDLVDGLKTKAWYARYDNAAGKVFYAEASDTTPMEWRDEVELFSFTGDDIDAISLAFDATGRTVVAMERNGNLWVRYWDGASYQLDDLGAGVSPALVHQAPDSIWRELYLLYEDGLDIKFRLATDDYATAADTLSNLLADERIERVILDESQRIHLILSKRAASIGRYTLSRISSDYVPPCMDMTGLFDRIDDGVETVFVFVADAELQVTCELDVDVLLIGAGGDSGADTGDPTTFWASAGGFALDPNVDTAPSDHIAGGGGAGGPDDRDGENGASGGGGGAQSPSNNSMRTQGGLGMSPQGHTGGGGRSSWGLLPRKTAASGGGGGYGGPGGAASDKAGEPGPGGAIAAWNWSGPRGGRGDDLVVHNPVPGTGPVTGGGGAGGVRTLATFTIQPDQAIQITVGQKGSDPGGNVGVGGDSIGGAGRGGMAAIRVLTSPLGSPAVLTGGTEIVDGGYRYHVFTASGVITVSTPGDAEVLLVAAGGGGGSNCGAGGGGGGVRLATLTFVAPTEAVTVGAGGAGGVASAVGADGGDSSVGTLAAALGGGGGAGQGTAAGNGATGGGGHGDDGDPGVGSPLRGYPGGQGGGYSLSAGGDSEAAGGGGAVGGAGEEGATQETQGAELVEDWDVSSTFVIDVAGEWGDEPSNASRALLSKNVSLGEMFVQGKGRSQHNAAEVGLAARASHPSGVDAAPDGHWCWFRKQDGRFGIDGTFGTGPGIALGTLYTMQLYVADGVQEAHMQTDAGVRRVATAVTTYDGEDDRSAGPRSNAGTTGAGRRIWDDFMCFRSKYITVGGIPSGGKAQVINSADAVLVEVVETAGESLLDCSRYGDGATGLSESVPVDGWTTLRVLDSGDVLVAEIVTGGIFPGDEVDVVGSELVYRDMGSGFLTLGLVEQEDFSRLTPGPLNGDGGIGRVVDSAWLVAAAGDSGVFGGGGGGGAELFVAGLGGDGGGGAGSVDTASPVAGTDEVGGGGGGSGDGATAGAVGGDGIVVIRTVIP